MFTGIIEKVCTISERTEIASDQGFTFTISDAVDILEDCHIGDSIACNGVCLTVVEFDKVQGWFKVGLAPETLSRSNLGLLREGDRLNCERAMSGKTRFGGHMVQGHVDGQATIISKIPDGNSIRYTFRLSPTNPTRLEPYLIEKGYVTVDGASLTLTEVNGDQFGIMLIAHSQSMLTLTNKEVGDTVNIEVDCVGKYVLKSLAGEGEGEVVGLEGLIERIVEKKLKEKGLI